MAPKPPLPGQARAGGGDRQYRQLRLRERAGHKIDVQLISEPDALTIKIADDGRAFDPLSQAPTPDVDANLEDRPIGGLGVYLVQTLMDEAHYRREQDRNHLTLVKRRDG